MRPSRSSHRAQPESNRGGIRAWRSASARGSASPARRVGSQPVQAARRVPRAAGAQPECAVSTTAIRYGHGPDAPITSDTPRPREPTELSGIVERSEADTAGLYRRVGRAQRRLAVPSTKISMRPVVPSRSNRTGATRDPSTAARRSHRRSAAVLVVDEEDPVVVGVGDPREVDVVEAAGDSFPKMISRSRFFTSSGAVDRISTWTVTRREARTGERPAPTDADGPPGVPAFREDQQPVLDCPACLEPSSVNMVKASGSAQIGSWL